jgi:hypothetical protein
VEPGDDRSQVFAEQTPKETRACNVRVESSPGFFFLNSLWEFKKKKPGNLERSPEGTLRNRADFEEVREKAFYPSENQIKLMRVETTAVAIRRVPRPFGLRYTAVSPMRPEEPRAKSRRDFAESSGL